jgi:hypothetical protein
VAAPDGTLTGFEYTNTGISNENAKIPVDPGAFGNVIHTKWVMGTTTLSPIVLALFDNATPNQYFTGTAFEAPTTWTRESLGPLTGVSQYINLAYINYEQTSWSGAVLLWGEQVENGLFATEEITTTNGNVTRPGERLFFPYGSALVDTGRLGMYAKFVPKAGRSAYSAPLPIWTVDANDYARIDNATGNLTVTIGGVAQTLSTSPVTWNAQDVVELWLEAGGGAGAGGTRASYRLNGGAVTVIGTNTTTQGTLYPPGAIDILCSGTTSEVSSWIQDVSFWRRGQRPAGM